MEIIQLAYLYMSWPFNILDNINFSVEICTWNLSFIKIEFHNCVRFFIYSFKLNNYRFYYLLNLIRAKGLF